VHLITSNYAEIEGVTVHLIGTGIEGSPFNFLKKSLQVRKLVREIEPDILHAHYVFGYGLFGAIANYHPFVVSAWGSDIFVEALQSFWKREIIKYAFKKADTILTTSFYLKNFIEKRFKVPSPKIEAIPWGVQVDIFHGDYEKESNELRKKLGVNNEDFVIFSPRGIKEIYGNSYILESLKYIQKKHQNTFLLMLKGCADNTSITEMQERKIKDLIKELNLEKYVIYINKNLLPNEMALYYNVSNVIISNPSSDQFSSCLQEGMACGCIPIVSDLEVYRQYLIQGENALFVERENPKDIAEKIIYCIEHPEIKENVYSYNKKIIEEKENWSKNAIKMEVLYAKIIEEKML
jgi:glycosyltransferase involved in cell wall biosynthesis